MKGDSSELGQRDLGYTFEKLRKALRDFDEAKGTLSQRLYEAWFQVHLLRAEDFPRSMQSDFREIVASITRLKDPIAPGAQGRIGDAHNTINHMPDRECAHILELLISLVERVAAKVAQEVGTKRTDAARAVGAE